MAGASSTAVEGPRQQARSSARGWDTSNCRVRASRLGQAAEQANKAQEDLRGTVKASEVAAPSADGKGGPSHQARSGARNHSTSDCCAGASRCGAEAEQASAARTATKVAIGDGIARRWRGPGPRAHGAGSRNARAERSRGRIARQTQKGVETPRVALSWTTGPWERGSRPSAWERWWQGA